MKVLSQDGFEGSTDYKRRTQMERLKRFLKDEDGASGVEYGILVAAVSALIVALAFSIGGKIQGAFNTVDTAIPAGT